MAARLFAFNAIDVGGGPASGALLNVYVRNTSTRTQWFTDPGLTTPATNPIEADADGRFSVYFEDAAQYRIACTTANGATSILQGDIVNGALLVNSSQTLIVDATWLPVISAPIGTGWAALLAAPSANAFGDFVTVQTNDQDILGRKRAAAKWKFGPSNDSYATSAGAPGGERASFTHYTSLTSGAAPEQFTTQNLTIVDGGIASGKQVRGDLNTVVVITDEFVQKVAGGSDYIEVRGDASFGESIFTRTSQLLHFSDSEIAVGHGFFGGSRLEDGSGGSYVLARGGTFFTRNTANFAVDGGFIDTAEAGYVENYVGPNAKTLVANGQISRIDNDGTVNSAFGYRAQFYNDGSITGDYFAFYAEQLNGNSVGGQSWAFYASTTANNYLAGDLRVGTVLAGDTKLNVNQSARLNVARFTRDDDGTLGPQLVSMHNSASPADNDTIWRWNFNGNNSSAAEVSFARDEVQAITTTAGAHAGRRSFYAATAGSLSRAAYIQAGLVVGSPTGADLGAGKINAEGVYDDNSLLTSYPLQYWVEGEIDTDFWDAKVANRVVEAEPDRRQVFTFIMDREVREKVLIDGQLQEVTRTVAVEEVITETQIDRDEAGNPRVIEMPAREIQLVDRDGQLMMEEVEAWEHPEGSPAALGKEFAGHRAALLQLERELSHILNGKAQGTDEEMDVAAEERREAISRLRSELGMVKRIRLEPRRELIPRHWKLKTKEVPVLEIVPGKPEEVIERQHEPMRKFMARLGTEFDPMTIEGQIAHVRAKRHLTPFPNPMSSKPDDQLTLGETVQRLTEWADLTFIYIAQQHERIKALEAERGPKPSDIIEEARNANPELFSNTEAADPEKEALREQVSDLQRQLSERVVEVPVAAVVEEAAPVEPYAPDFTLIPDALAKYAEADETADDFRKRLKRLWQRFGIADGENFPGGGEPLSGEEKITMREIDIVLNSDEGRNAGLLQWLQADERNT